MSTLANQRDSISSEDDLQEYLQSGMESSGWDVLREMSPDHRDTRADIIAKHTDVGWIGIECKHVTGGSVAAGNAARQVIKKYAGEKYLGIGIEIDMWGIALYGRHYSAERLQRDDYDSDQFYHETWGLKRGTVSATERIINALGIGWVTVQHDRVLCQFLPSGRDVSVPLFWVNDEFEQTYYDELDTERISELTNRMP